MKALKPFLLLLPLVLLGCSSGGDKQVPPQPVFRAEVRETGPLPAEAYGFAISFASPIPTLHAGEVANVQAVVKNTSSVAWPGKALSKTVQPINASYHIRSMNGELVLWDGIRTQIASNVPPGSEVAVILKIKAPDSPGKYMLEPDLVQENVAWFSKRTPGIKPLAVEFQVQASHQQ